MSDAIQAITMPKWGLAMTEGLVAAWHVDVGASIAAGDDAVDIETEKITNVYESPASGVLRRQVVAAGEVVPVGALLGVVTAPDVADADVDAFVEAFNARFAEELSARASEDAAGPEPETVDVAGLTMRYLDLGEGEGTPMVLVHGFGGDLNGWLFNQPVLAEGRRVIALDLPGHGGSGKAVAAPDVDGLARSVSGLLDALGLDRVHLVGHSLGAAVSITIASSAPGRVASLSLLSPAGLGPEIDTEYIEGFISAGRRKQMKAVLGRLFADPELVTREMVEDVLKFKRLDGASAALETIAGAVFAGGTQAKLLREDLAALGMPVLVLWGREDRIVPAAHAEGLPEQIVVQVLDGAGHMPQMERATEVNAAIERNAAAAG